MRSRRRWTSISNNLANVGTTGFKRGRVVFEDLLYQNVRQAGAQLVAADARCRPDCSLVPACGQRPPVRMHTQGNLQKTENPFDMAINGQGFFQIQLPDGTTGYTRDGSFHVDANGQIVTSNGFPLQPAITVPPSAQSVTIGQDGTVTRDAGRARRRRRTSAQHPAGELRQSGRARIARPEPVRRNGGLGHA